MVFDVLSQQSWKEGFVAQTINNIFFNASYIKKVDIDSKN